ncbi:hypothetical protein KAR91_48710 [Candidatus Pacearchaeota archaeon]|nr:hypothetical protein [Candidatus Pacearchaeota archaeon]
MYTTVFTKESVKKISDEDYLLSVNVVINDGTNDVKKNTFSVRYNKGWLIEDVAIKLYRKIKIDWDKYLAEKLIYDKAAFTVMIGTAKSNFDTYINS